MTGFFALLRLQLLSRLADLKPRNFKAALKEQKGRTIGMAIAIVFLVIYLGAILFIVENKMLDVLMKMGTPDMLISMAVTLATVGTLIMSFFFVLSSLYLGRDAAYLAAMPLKARTILSAKLVQVWISETCIDALLLLPACILYGVKTGVSFSFYLRLIPVWLLIAVLPICIIAFVSSLIIRVSGLWKHRELVMTVAGIALMVGYIFLMMNLGSVTGDSADGGEMMQRFMMDYSSRIESMTSMFPPAVWAAKGLLGADYGLLGLWIAVSLAAPVITVWLLGYSYRKLSLLQIETPEGGNRKFTGRESYSVGSQFAACCKRDVFAVPAEDAGKAGRQGYGAGRLAAVERKVEPDVALRRRRRAADALQVRRLRLDQDLFVERRCALHAGDAGVKVPERMRAPAVAVAARIDLRRLEDG